MANILSRLEDELRRLENGPMPNEKPGGMGTVCFTVRCPFDGAELLTRAKSVLQSHRYRRINGMANERESITGVARMVYVGLRLTDVTRTSKTVACVVEGTSSN